MLILSSPLLGTMARCAGTDGGAAVGCFCGKFEYAVTSNSENEIAPLTGEELVSKLNLETAKINWKELQLFFARGKVIHVHEHLDLIRIAASIADDAVEAIERHLKSGEINLITDAQARIWLEEDTIVWAVVTRPWVLVQAVGSEAHRSCAK